MLFTIFTPAYNRSECLTKLYNSLLLQSNKDFEWIIVDDGSTDDTENIVNKFINENKIKINYLKKKNEGKHIAINVGSTLAKGRYFFIVDSDDSLTKDALSIAEKYISEIDSKKEFAGVAFLRCNQFGNAWNRGGNFNQPADKSSLLYEQEYIDASYLDYRYKCKLQGDRAEIIKTSIIKQNPFPKFKDEHFLSERYLWDYLSDLGYKFRWINIPIYITEYRSDGLTKNIGSILQRNPEGVKVISNRQLHYKEMPFTERIKSCIRYGKYSALSGNSLLESYKECNWKILSMVLIPVGFFAKNR